MSWQATAWAIEQDQIEDTGQKFVLVCLANYAGEDGRDAFPSIATLCRHTCLSESTVRRKLQDLETAGLISRGNQKLAEAKIERADRRPIVYDLPIERGVTVTPRESNGVSKTGERGVKHGPTGCQALTPDPPSLILPKPKSVERRPFEEEFKRRYGVTPSEASALRAAVPPQKRRTQ